MNYSKLENVTDHFCVNHSFNEYLIQKLIFSFNKGKSLITAQRHSEKKLPEATSLLIKGNKCQSYQEANLSRRDISRCISQGDAALFITNVILFSLLINSQSRNLSVTL